MHITSRDNPKIKEIALLQKSVSARREAGLLVCEGPVLLREALGSGLIPQTLFVLEGHTSALPEGISCDLHTVSGPVMGKMQDTVTGSTVLFTLPIPRAAPPQNGPILALDGVADPGNLGTILRTADALGGTVALLPGGADPTAPKVARAAMGSLFRRFPWVCDYAALAAHCAAHGIPLYAAALREDAEDIRQVSLHDACILIGNEARGVSAQGLDICQKSVIIPMRGAESLNAAVAAAILLWEALT